MSILLIGLDEERGPAIVRRLLDEGDVVGVIEDDARRSDVWRALGAHVAVGSGRDPDLVERAAQHARSIVVLARGGHDAEVLAAVLQGARLAPGGAARIVYVTDESRPEENSILEASAFDYVVLRTGGRRGFIRRGRAVDPDDLAEAVSAADDLAGEPRLDVDLTDPAGRSALALGPS
ncbi:MAG: NAD-binding protein [Actinomycetota bacterium]|nr:NAD-binding protein [Actinomycetota bacterium]